MICLNKYYNKIKLNSNIDEITEILKELIKIPSHVGEPKGEERLALRIKEILEAEKINSELIYVEQNRPNIIAYYQNNSNHNVLLTGHTDINPPHGMKIPPFEGIIKDGKIFGRGAADMKGGLAAMIYSIILLKRSNLEAQTGCIFAGVIGEATGGSEGIKHFIKNRPVNITSGIVGEPTGCNIVIANKGMQWFEVVIRGKSAFGAYPEKGINAIEGMVSFINYLKQELYPLLKKRRHKLLGSPTINIGTIEGYGGYRRPNVVPDYCKIQIDRRLIPGETEEGVFREFCDLAAKFEKNSKHYKIEVYRIPEMADRLPMEINANEPVVKVLKESHITVFNKRPRIIGSNGFTDASYLVNEAKIPTIVYGPGMWLGDTDYSEESISIEEVYKTALVYCLTILGFNKYLK